jgi:hypothetical protein
LVAQRGEEPGEAIADVVNIGVERVTRRGELVSEPVDGGADVRVLGAETVNPVTQARLASHDVGEKAVDFIGIALFFTGHLIEGLERSKHVVKPVGLTTWCGTAERCFELVHRFEGAILILAAGDEPFSMG